MAEQRKTKEGFPKVALIKSYQDVSTSFVSPNYSHDRKDSWFYNAVEVVDELAINTGDNQNYTFAPGQTKAIINSKYFTDRKRYPNKCIKVKKNDVEVVSSLYTIDYSTKTITFNSANEGSDVIKVSYAYENGSTFELVASPGKVIKLDYVETQFSHGCIFNDTLMFELLLNNAQTGDTDVVMGYEEYQTAADFLNKGNHGTTLGCFGELTKNINVFPWNYLSGYTLKPVGTIVDPTIGEFNKIRMYLKNDQGYTNCELATGTFYCFIEDLISE